MSNENKEKRPFSGPLSATVDNQNTVCAEQRNVFSCPTCYLGFKSKFNMRRHMQRKHANESANLEKKSPGKFSCSFCCKSYDKKYNLLRHVRIRHPNESAQLEDEGKDRIERKFSCSFCTKSFERKYHLSRHISTCHPNNFDSMCSSGEKLDYKTRNPITSTINKCPLCNENFNSNEILNHFQNSHYVKLEMSELKFETFENFSAWKNNIENETKSKFVRYGNKNTQKSGNTKYSFKCHRSGYYKSQGDGLRHLKVLGSCKINAYCPASLKVIESKDGECAVYYQKTHVGHNNDLGHLNLTYDERKSAAEKISLNIPFDSILDDIRVSVCLLSKNKMIQCSICAATFTLRKNLNQHMRKKHNIDPPILGGKITCPMLCVDKFRTHKDLRSHLESFHEFIIEKEEHAFPDIEAFETWKKRFEMTSGYAYTCRISEKKLNKGATKKHFICHRSGIFKSESTGKKQLKKIGSNKIGNTCPSIMEVSRSLSDGTVDLLFWKTHIGHDPDLKRTPAPRKVHPKKSDSITYEVCAIVPAAGIGERMGLDTPKQYIPIHEKPVICYTVDAFIRIPFIKKVVVVAASQDLDFMLQTLSQMCALKDEKLMVTEGCGTRHQSIEAGIKALQTCCEIQPQVVVIHDGVRPFFSEEIVCNVILAAKEFGAAGVVCPLVSTVVSLDENSFLDSSLDRNKFKASEMPQAFQFDIISAAYAMSTAHDLEYGTECLHLVQKYCNVKAKLLPGTTNLWKITHRKDIYTAAAAVKENQSVAILIHHPLSDDLVSHLQTSLCKKFDSVHTIGKLNDSSYNKFSNIVQLWKNKSISTILEELENDYSVPKSTELLSILYITLDNFDEKLNFIDVQKKAKTLAKEMRSVRCLFYFIFLPKDSLIDSIKDAAEFVTSLLFNCDPHISGTIFLL